ncbi:unnamed protein product, partial [Phytomonas sp. Hart1]
MCRIILLATLLLLLTSQIGSADVIFRSLHTIEDSLQIARENENNQILFFFDPLDINTDRAMSLLKKIDTRKKDILIYTVDCRENFTAWLRSSFGVTYFPSLILFHKVNHGSRKVENFNPFVVKPEELF